MNKDLFKLILLSGVLIFLAAGCKPQAAITVTPERNCGDAECAEDEYCITDSSGQRCESKEAVASMVKKPELSCAGNVVQPGPGGGINIYDTGLFICDDKCPKGFKCTDECVCEEEKKVACPKPEIHYVQPDQLTGEYSTNYFPSLFEFHQVRGNAFKLEEAWTELSVWIPVMAYTDQSDYKSYLIPFPSEQFTVSPPSPTHVPCANEYFVGDTGYALNKTALPQPDLERWCGWGGTGPNFEAVLNLCARDAAEWLEGYLNQWPAPVIKKPWEIRPPGGHPNLLDL